MGHATEVAYEGPRLTLARLKVEERGELELALRRALGLAARTLRCTRTSLWFLDRERAWLACRLAHDEAARATAPPPRLDLRRFPRYRDAILERRAVIAPDAQVDPSTCELTAEYLAPLGITSMLDAPVYRDGEVVGIVCHEQVGPPRTWSDADVAFATTTADLITTLHEQADRLDCERELRDHLAALPCVEKLQVLEQLARSVGHDLNNVLTAVLAVSSLLERGGPPPPDLADTLRSCVQVGADLVAQLRRFGGRPQDAMQPRPAAEVVADLRPILAALVRDVATLDVAIEAADTSTRVPAALLERIVLNLVTNARDALDGRPGTIRIRLAEDAGGLLLEVADDGAGMSDEVLGRIWDPYFTTKPSGTGVGLASVRRMADDHGIAIDVASAPGRGARFRLVLPR